MSAEAIRIGELIDSTASRDAIHVAIAPVVAGTRLSPGDRVGLNEYGHAVLSDKPSGIVDPFLRSGPERGQRFWLFLFPGSVTSLRHSWEHPDFDRPDNYDDDRYEYDGCGAC